MHKREERDEERDTEARTRQQSHTHLRHVHDGCGQQGTVHASIADGECATCHVIDADGAIACFLAQTGERL